MSRIETLQSTPARRASRRSLVPTDGTPSTCSRIKSVTTRHCIPILNNPAHLDKGEQGFWNFDIWFQQPVHPNTIIKNNFANFPFTCSIQRPGPAPPPQPRRSGGGSYRPPEAARDRLKIHFLNYPQNWSFILRRVDSKLTFSSKIQTFVLTNSWQLSHQ